MNKMYKFNEKATLCSNGKCVTVYGDTAKMINTIMVLAVLVAVISYVSKALR